MRSKHDQHSILEYELNHLFLSFCTFITLTYAKKLNLANIFLLLLQKKDLRDFFKIYCDVSSDFAVVQTFLKFDPSLYKSKYVMKFLNSVKDKIIM
jgi:hypothetical protein